MLENIKVKSKPFRLVGDIDVPVTLARMRKYVGGQMKEQFCLMHLHSDSILFLPVGNDHNLVISITDAKETTFDGKK